MMTGRIKQVLKMIGHATAYFTLVIYTAKWSHVIELQQDLMDLLFFRVELLLQVTTLFLKYYWMTNGQMF